jgi:hypothetical protein
MNTNMSPTNSPLSVYLKRASTQLHRAKLTAGVLCSLRTPTPARQQMKSG